MDSSFQQQQFQHHFQDPQRQFYPHQKQPPNSLTRFRSAPSTYFSSFLDAAAAESLTPAASSAAAGDFSNARPLSPETENIFERFISDMGAVEQEQKPSSSERLLSDIPENSPVANQTPAQLMVEVKQEYQGSFVTSPQAVVYSQSKPPLANQKTSLKSSARTSSMGVMNSMPPQKKINSNNNNNKINSSGLTRHSSSPAGFFANILNILDNGFGEMKPQAQAQTQTQTQAPSSSRLMNQNSFDSIMSENLSSLADDQKNFCELDISEIQSRERLNRPPRLVHHLSLPKTLSDISDMEKLLFEDSVVPCRIRAKRGCATHPRSIAERVRRTKISERMRKLQDLVPNMDKQTNTADMLDLAVEHIKDLQKQVKILADYRTNCTCLRYTRS